MKMPDIFVKIFLFVLFILFLPIATVFQIYIWIRRWFDPNWGMEQ